MTARYTKSSECRGCKAQVVWFSRGRDQYGDLVSGPPLDVVSKQRHECTAPPEQRKKYTTQLEYCPFRPTCPTLVIYEDHSKDSMYQVPWGDPIDAKTLEKHDCHNSPADIARLIRINEGTRIDR
jgi:hypothetical protein